MQSSVLGLLPCISGGPGEREPPVSRSCEARGHGLGDWQMFSRGHGCSAGGSSAEGDHDIYQAALLVMIQAHEEDHRADQRDAMARARRVCWIPGSRALALRVIKNCEHGRKWRKQVQEQVMGDLPSSKQLPTAPFTVVGCYFMGPYLVKGICSGRRQFKV